MRIRPSVAALATAATTLPLVTPLVWASEPAVTTQIPASCTAFTWTVFEQELDRPLTRIRSDQFSNAYTGDTDCSRHLPVVCLHKTGTPEPRGIAVDFYNGWTGGEVRFSRPVPATRFQNATQADAFCAQEFGTGFRMGEHHDGNGGWGWWAAGKGRRVWVDSDDAPTPWTAHDDAASTWVISGRKGWSQHGSTYSADVHTSVKGDTSLNDWLPLLCTRPGQRSVEKMTIVRATSPLQGHTLTSLEDAQAQCLNHFGPGWFPFKPHDEKRAVSEDANERFWVSINDQPANGWNGTRPLPTSTRPTYPPPPSTTRPTYPPPTFPTGPSRPPTPSESHPRPPWPSSPPSPTGPQPPPGGGGPLPPSTTPPRPSVRPSS